MNTENLRKIVFELQFFRANDPDPNTLKVTGHRVFCVDEKCKNGDELDLALYYEAGKLPEQYHNYRHVETIASYFTGTTKFNNMKLPYNNKINPPTYSSYNNYFLNLENVLYGKPDIWQTLAYRVPPRNNDFLCGLVRNGKFEKWFISSEQFFRTVMLLRMAFMNNNIEKNEEDVLNFNLNLNFGMYDPTPDEDRKQAAENGLSIETKMVKESLRRLLMRNNTLAIGSAVHKVAAARQHNGTPPLTFEELCKTYVRTRCEEYTRRPDCVHLYAALVTMIFYREPLTPENVPKNIFRNPKPGDRTEVTLKWVVPSFITNS